MIREREDVIALFLKSEMREKRPLRTFDVTHRKYKGQLRAFLLRKGAFTELTIQYYSLLHGELHYETDVLELRCSPWGLKSWRTPRRDTSKTDLSWRHWTVQGHRYYSFSSTFSRQDSSHYINDLTSFPDFIEPHCLPRGVVRH